MAKSPTKPKEKPIDPLAHVHVHMREAAGKMPALSPAPQVAAAGIGHNSDAKQAAEQAEELLNSAIDRINALDAQIATLNKGKADVYAELKKHGLDVKIIQQLIKEGKVDPLVLADRERKLEIYRAAVRPQPVKAGEKAA